MPVEWRDHEGRSVPTTPGEPVGDEPTVDGRRVWRPEASKLAAVLDAGVELPLDGARVLYLGAAAGTTASYVADVARATYCVEFARGPARRLLAIARQRPRMFPIVADARRPERYVPLVETVDLVYQDVATSGQAEVALANARFLRDDGVLCCCVKARSEDVAADPDAVFDDVADRIGEELDVARIVDLEPAFADHAAIVARR